MAVARFKTAMDAGTRLEFQESVNFIMEAFNMDLGTTVCPVLQRRLNGNTQQDRPITVDNLMRLGLEAQKNPFGRSLNQALRAMMLTVLPEVGYQALSDVLREQNYDVHNAIWALESDKTIDGRQGAIARFMVQSLSTKRTAESYLNHMKGRLRPALAKACRENAITPGDLLATKLSNLFSTSALHVHQEIKKATASAKQDSRNEVERAAVRSLYQAKKSSLSNSLEEYELESRYWIWNVGLEKVHDFYQSLSWRSGGQAPKLSDCEHEIKVHIINSELKVGRDEAEERLAGCGGDLNGAISSALLSRQQAPALANLQLVDTRHPPDIDQDTHVISLLGIHDRGAPYYEGSPQVDGFLVSDFYLWKNLVEGMGKTQKWLTCVDPTFLVRTYCSGNRDQSLQRHNQPIGLATNRQISWNTGYVHGDPWEERRIVLGPQKQTGPSSVQFARENLEITKPEDLLSTFLSRLEAACQVAEHAGKKSKVMVLIFAHGDLTLASTPGGMFIGDAYSSIDAGRILTPTKFAAAIEKTPNVSTSIFATSCFSGQWVTSDAFKLGQRPTIVTASKPYEMAYSWEPSNSMRHCGTVFNEALRQVVEKQESQVPRHADVTSCLVMKMQGLSMLERLGWGAGSTPLFTDEDLSATWWERTGYELLNYKERYDALPKVPASDMNPKLNHKRPDDDSLGKAYNGWLKRNPEAQAADQLPVAAGYGATVRGLRSNAEMLATIYESSKPGAANDPTLATLANMIRGLKSGRLSSIAGLGKLQAQLAFRIAKMEEVERYSVMLGLTLGESFGHWDPDSGSQQVNQNNFEQALKMVYRSNLFKPTDEDMGGVYHKPYRYLAYKLLINELDEKSCRAKLQEIEKVLDKQRKQGTKRAHDSGSFRKIEREMT